MMLDHLKKFFTAVEPKEDPEMAQEPTQAPALAVNQTAELATAQAALATQAEALSTALAEVATLKQGLEQATAQLAALTAETAAKRLQARKEAIEAAVGTVKAPALMAATESLDDTQFNAVIGAMAASFDAEAKSTMFTEAGVAAEVIPEAVEKDTVAKLAAAIEAEFNQTK